IGLSIAMQVVGRRIQAIGDVGHLALNEIVSLEHPDADRDIRLATKQVEPSRIVYEIDCHQLVARAKAGRDRAKTSTPQPATLADAGKTRHRDRTAQPGIPRRTATLARLRLLLHLIERLDQDGAQLAGRQTSRSALEKLDADASLERAEPAADGRLRRTQRPG